MSVLQMFLARADMLRVASGLALLGTSTALAITPSLARAEMLRVVAAGLALLGTSTLAIVPADVPAAGFWATYASTAGLSPLPAHTPQFFLEQVDVPFLGSAGPYNVPLVLVRDAAAQNAVVATYAPRTSFAVQTNASENGELNLLGGTPSTIPLDLPTLPRYGWAWLYGAKVTTYTWLDCCSVTGDTHGSTLVADGPSNATVTLNEWQAWVPNGTHAGRDAVSNHTFTLRWDATYGYVVDALTSLRINAKAAPATAEFLNMLTPRLMQPWPEGGLLGSPFPRSNMTAYANDTEGRAWVGFANNILAGAELRTYDLPTLVGGVVFVTPASPEFPAAGSPAIAFGADEGSGITFRQMTCPTWADQHQVVVFPPSPGPDGYFTLLPSFSVRFLPEPAADHIYAHTDLLHADGGSRGPPPGVPLSRWFNSTLLRVGVVDSFEADPVDLTSPVRALAQAWSSPDYVLLTGPPGTGRGNSTAALVVQAVSADAADAPYAFSNPQPLVPLNLSTNYVASAWFAPRTNGSFEAWLWVGIYEADDFNAAIAPGPGYGRIASFYSTVLECAGGQCGAGEGDAEGGWTTRRRGKGRGGGAGEAQEVEPGVFMLPSLPPDLRPRLLRRGVEPEDGGTTTTTTTTTTAQWTRLDVEFQGPPWSAYADVRIFAVNVTAGDGTEQVLVDDFYFGVL
jgi:hypothetical protein